MAGLLSPDLCSLNPLFGGMGSTGTCGNFLCKVLQVFFEDIITFYLDHQMIFCWVFSFVSIKCCSLKKLHNPFHIIQVLCPYDYNSELDIHSLIQLECNITIIYHMIYPHWDNSRMYTLKLNAIIDDLDLLIFWIMFS